MTVRPIHRILLLAFATSLLSCVRNQSHLDMLTPCPSSPNCVSSDARDSGHQIAPLELSSIDAETWAKIKAVVSGQPRTTLIQERENYLRFECRSAILRFVDELELEWRPADRVVAVRSASRVGYSDFGVNRRRVEALRRLLRERGLVR